MKKYVTNQNGSSLVAAIVAMLVLGAAAAAVVNISGTDTKSYTDNMQSSQAFSVSNAGLQWALDKLNHGESPNVVDKNFDNGSFTVISDPTSSSVTATGRVGDAKRTQTINADFARNCINMLVSQAYIDGNTLHDVKFEKTCNLESILSKLTLTWNASICATSVNCDGTIAVDDVEEEEDDEDCLQVTYEDVGKAPKNKFWICHVPPGNPQNKQTISVSVNGWVSGHNSGTGNHHNQDYLGPCIVSTVNTCEEDEEEPVVVTCEGTNLSEEALSDCASDSGNLDLTTAVLAGTTIFNAGVLPQGSAKTSSGSETDIADSVMSTNTTYDLDLTFDTVIPTGTWFTINAEFADGSELNGVFRAGNQPAPLPVETPPDDQPPANTPDDSFEVTNGVVIVDPNQKIDLKMLGAAIQCGEGGPEVNVKAQLCIGSNCSYLFNSADIDGGETYSTTNSVANTQYTVKATAWLSSCNNFSATYSSTNTVQVKSLRNGDQAPALSGFGGQKPVTQFLSSYLTPTGKVTLNSNQVIMLFELGADLAQTPNSTAADFQDLVVLMTISDL